MNDIERLLGKLEGFKEATVSRLDKIEVKLDDLWKFRWRIAGATSFAGFLGGAIVSYLWGIR